MTKWNMGWWSGLADGRNKKREKFAFGRIKFEPIFFTDILSKIFQDIVEDIL